MTSTLDLETVLDTIVARAVHRWVNPGGKSTRGEAGTLSELVYTLLDETSAELLGETAEEWQKLEKVVQLGQWTSGPRADEGRLCQLAELRVPLRVEGYARLRSRSSARARRAAGSD